MAFTARFLLITFIESFGTICVERGVYFYTEHRLGWSDAMNLGLALAFGLAYVAGALTSHKLAQRFGEKRLLVASIALQLGVHLAMAALADVGLAVSVGATLAGLLYGLKWPIVESYVSAGRGGVNQVRSLGRFSIAWSSTVPLALIASGPMIELWAPGVFLMPALINVVTLALLRPVHRRPDHLPDEHPERASTQHIAKLQPLLHGGRWLLLASYASMFILAPLMPRIFRDLGYMPAAATALSGVLDITRVSTFLLMWVFHGWHCKRWPLVMAMVLLSPGLLLALFGGRIEWVVVGQLMFGLAMGLVYYASIYYAVVVRNADVGAGGGHEGLIGAGFALGPLAGLAGIALQNVMGSRMLGTLSTLGVVLAFALLMAARCLLRKPRVLETDAQGD
jgi:MFS family permease